MSVNEKIIIEMGDQNNNIEFCFSFPTIYHNFMYANGKVPPKIMLLYGGISSYYGAFPAVYVRTYELIPP